MRYARLILLRPPRFFSVEVPKTIRHWTNASISWAIADGDKDWKGLDFVWKETGGPNVTQPTSKGFGSRLISRVFAADFNGDARINYAPDGVVCV